MKSLAKKRATEVALIHILTNDSNLIDHHISTWSVTWASANFTNRRDNFHPLGHFAKHSMTAI